MPESVPGRRCCEVSGFGLSSTPMKGDREKGKEILTRWTYGSGRVRSLVFGFAHADPAEAAVRPGVTTTAILEFQLGSALPGGVLAQAFAGVRVLV